MDKLSKSEQEELVFELLSAITYCSSMKDAAVFFQDLLTLREMKIMAKRLRIAKLLIAGYTYENIEQILHVSHSTVGKIAAWLTERGDGFRKVISKISPYPKEKTFDEITDWDRYKRHHALYFWPELLLEEIITNANKKQKLRIKNALDRLEEKSELHKRLEKLILA